MHAGLAYLHCAPRPTFSSQMACMIPSLPVDQPSTYLTPLQLQLTVSKLLCVTHFIQLRAAWPVTVCDFMLGAH